jgi:hypothetical protein
MLTEIRKTTKNPSQRYNLTPYEISVATRHEQGVNTPNLECVIPNDGWWPPKHRKVKVKIKVHPRKVQEGPQGEKR